MTGHGDARVGWPWCGDVPSGGEIRGSAIATVDGDGMVALVWDRAEATCTIVSRPLLDGIVDERNRLIAEVERLRGAREATVQAIEDAVADLDIDDLAAYDVERIARVACAQFRVGEVERLRIIETASIGAHALLADAEAEVERLRGLLAEALDAWTDAHQCALGFSHIASPDRIAEIRREADLT